MAVKFSQFLAEALSSPSYLVGYNSTTNLNVRVSYADLVAAFTPGSGTVNYVAKWTSTSVLGNSSIFDNGTSVGIGTATPSSKLEVNGGTLTVIGSGTSVNEFRANGIIAIDLTPNLSDDYKFRTLVAVSGDVTQTAVNNFSLNSGGYLGLGGGGSEKMRITSAGRVLIGTTTESTYELDVVGDIRSTLDANINGLTVGKGGGSVASNTAVGLNSLRDNVTGSGNTAIGNNALVLNTNSLSTAVGGNALASLTGSGQYSTAVGYNALTTSTSGGENSAFGMEALRLSTTGASNTGIGARAGLDITTGSGNTLLGRNAGRGITTGQYNTIIGAEVTGLSSSLSNTIILADGQGNQRLYIDNAGEVGIGTTSPNYKLHVVNSTQNTAQALFTGSSSPFILTGTWATYGQHFSSLATFIGNNAYPSDAGNNSWTRIGAAGSLVGWINIGEAGMFFASGINAASGGSRGDSKMALFPTGNLGIGVGVTDAGYKLDVNGTARIGTMTLTGTATNQIAIGGTTTGNSSVALGSSSTAALQSIAIGEAASANQNSIAIGRSATTNAQGQFVVGGANNGINDIYFGRGITAATTENVTINVNGASGTDITGKNLTLAAGKATGNAVGGDLIFSTSDATTSGTTLQSLTAKMTLKAGGSVGIGTASPNASALLDVSSTTKGFLPPRMTNAQMVAIATPAAGLVVYDTTNNKLNVYDGSTWIAVH